MSKLLKNGFKDHLFCGNQKQSGPFKITKEGFYKMIQKSRSVFRSIAFQLETSLESRISSWYKMKRVVAMVLRYKKLLKKI